MRSRRQMGKRKTRRTCFTIDNVSIVRIGSKKYHKYVVAVDGVENTEAWTYRYREALSMLFGVLRRLRKTENKTNGNF